ncbi:MAG: oxygenase MpaB family protein [Myxococcaceae bacterium]
MIDVNEVQRALDRAHRVLWKSQRADGSWDTPGEVGPWVTAQVVTSLKYLDALDADDTAGAAKWLTLNQRDDGSFGIHPYSTSGNLGSTACGWAALHLCGARDAAAKAETWVRNHGGLAAVIDLINEGDFAPVFLAMAGLVDPKRVPCPSTTGLVLPFVQGFLETRFHSGVLMGAFQTEFLLRKLRGDFGPDGTRKSLVDKLKARAALNVFRTFQNDDGSWNDSTVISVLVLPGLQAIGTDEARSMLQRALSWISTQKIRDADGMHFAGFGTEVWATAFDVRALLAGGISATDADVTRALEWLVNAQLQNRAMPHVDNRKPTAVLTGGWAFQRTNHTMPDCDDAGVTLSALGVALKDPKVPPAVRSKLADSAARGKEWLYSMQNPDGGWSAFVWDLPPKKPGPMMEKNARIEMGNPLAMVGAVLHPPPVTGDPSTEDLTSRVLHGLGQLGESVNSSPSVVKAVEFLKKQQWTNGAWWGRWVVNYLSASAFVLLGLRAVGVDMKEAWVQRAVRWMISKQNADGGWGEGPESYVNESAAGVGPTMLPLTALVVQALIDAGEGDSEAVQKAMRLLLKTQRADGTWSNGAYLHTNVPPDTFYVYPEAARFYPTEALGKYLAHRQHRSTAGDDRVKWNDALLDACRMEADPVADGVIASLFADGKVDRFNTLMSNIWRTDQAIPPALPPEVEAYFKDIAFPAWADQAQIRIAEKLFTRTGWQVAMGLFCSSLPQAYAAAKGAHVITQTQGMTGHQKQRIFETGQFLFDVMDEGALAPGGRGVFTAKKVRLMHAAVRHLILERKDPKWDLAFFGKPINQEDLAGTLMTFSVVTLEGLRLLGVPYSAEEGAAWLHAWKVVGHFMGLKPELLPADLIDGSELMEAIRDRQWRTSEDGKILTRSLVEMMQSYFPGDALDGFPNALIRTLAGDHCADLLGVPPADWTRAVIDAGVVIDQFVPRDPNSGLEQWVAWATHRFMELVVKASREGKNAKFRIPKSLQDTVDPNF